MKTLAMAAAVSGAIAALSSAAVAQTAPPATEPQEYTPWYEQKILPPPLSATVTFTTDYRFRGISQTSRAPGYQGGLEFEQEIFKDVSAFAGIWASNVNFPGASVEIDVYGGLKGKFTDAFGWQVQAIGYLYPGKPDGSQLDYFEMIPSLSYDFGFLSVAGGVALSPNYTANSGFAVWPYVDVSVPVPLDIAKPYKLAVIGHFGYQAVDRNFKFGAPDYAEWSMGLGATVYGFDLQVKYVDTNVSRGQCFGGERWCSAGVVFQLSKRF